ncbi:ATP-binding cassette domain-containing protein [Paenibacillus sp. MMS20-IR301]|uniref:ATP-binding cassette domain-containing protein n=1 Tax=Paenibacillus sp. MMS20-IR301 TaxID=2895946 RepID=UPI0028EC3978|nr:ATP-binding cassette domain-containing protein [Paenibacillus sp. MMS20-IR301]WNS44082.1 ATP-binding cassette domain-containing protein [Paenibacillus sp. MMS20-IR301]
MSEYVLQAHQLSKYYKKHPALEVVDLSIRRGSIYGFIGQNGAGKSTFMRIAAGLSRPSSGRIELFGAGEGAKLVQARKRIGTTIETPALFPHMSAAENLEVFRLQQGIRDKTRIRQTLSLVGLAEAGNKTAGNFSLGMKQRLGLAVALLGNPELLILDEPTNGLDPVGVVELRELLLRLHRERNISILMSSHILSELHLLATDYGIIHNGRMLEQLTANELQAKCRQYLHIKVDSPETAVGIIQGEYGSSECVLDANGIIRLYEPFGRPGELSAKLFAAGLEVQQFMPEGDKLERYYTKLIGGADNGKSVAV